MSFNRHIVLVSLVLCPFLCVGGCASKTIPDTYYSLLPGKVAGTATPTFNQHESRLTLVRISLPKFLQRQNLVMQKGAHTLVPAQHHFWAEPLEDGIAKVLVLGIMKNSKNLLVENNAGRWSKGSNCSLRLEFDSFHATQSGQILSAGHFWLQGAKSTSPLVQPFSYSDDLLLDGYTQVITQLQSSLQKLASSIVTTINDSSVCE